ncbi:endolytic transglycosylase MltG [Nocardia wallacei]|uniref:Endolytic murein transglycosylase n=1 Tax=Nocardia wallacei TaxID=480035 RepID=A0A7G1KPN6_9NOCA|nr:endolytic transglycosylase MltG [Nocardia wallacei]BCK55224.1 aminodeoxychorismate lyase [Nocardia wallacei]
MNDRWARAEERHRQSVEERRYRRRDSGWGADDRAARGRGSRHAAPVDDAWDDYDDDTTVIPVYTDEEPEPVPPPRPQRTGQRRAPARGRSAENRSAADEPPRRRPARERPARKETGRSQSGRGQSARSKRSRVASRKAAERQRRRRNLWILGIVFVVLFVAAGGYAGYKFIGKLGGPEDFAGPAGPPVVVRVNAGDTAEQIAQTMYDKGVVASTGAFYEAAIRNSKMNSVQPGFYAVPSHSKGSEAVTALMSKASRVGNVVISEGRLLHDQSEVKQHGTPTPGIYSLVSQASCMGPEPARRCVTADELAAAGAGTDLAALGVPPWAEQEVRRAPDRSRQLEGLIAAGSLDFDPSGTPQQILHQLITQSAAAYESTGLLQAGAANGLSPYQTLIAASLVEREAKPNDMAKVARVIVNRLKVGQMLQFDSTVNYALNEIEVATTDADRAKVTPWNTYAMTGLPANPIAAPSLNALHAVENPAPGDWLYFVTVDNSGTTLFTKSYSDHLRNITQAQDNGVLDSGR